MATSSARLCSTSTTQPSSPPEIHTTKSESNLRQRASEQLLSNAVHRFKASLDESTTDNKLASPCYFHRRFDDAVDIGKVLEEIAADDSMSHSRLMQTATGVREVSKQLQRRPIKRAVRNVMIITKARDNDLVKLTRELAEWLLCTPRYGSPSGINVYVDQKLRNSRRFDAVGLVSQDLSFESKLRYWTPDLCWTSPEKFDLVLTLGGDGTVLFTSWLFQRIVPPILSFSLGSLGFLTPFDFENFRTHLNHVLGGIQPNGCYSGISTPIRANSDVVSDAGMRVNLRMRFTCTVFRAPATTRRNKRTSFIGSVPPPTPAEESSQFEVLNELVIDRGPSPYVSNLELFDTDELLTVIQADGVIFSTPTGSTAYSLSAGGSLVHPDIPAILLTPICPHTLSFRPMLLNDNMRLRIAVPRNSRATAYCSFDGKGRIELRQGDYVTIAASQYPFPTVIGARKTEWIDSVSRTLRWNTREARQKGWSGGSEGKTKAGRREEFKVRAVAEEDEYGEGEDDDEEAMMDGEDEEFDIDFDPEDDVEYRDRDSGYGGEGASTAAGGAATPVRRSSSLLVLQ